LFIFLFFQLASGLFVSIILLSKLKDFVGRAACDQLPSFFWNLSSALYFSLFYGFEMLNAKDIRDKRIPFW
jgi:hypothetical protein